MTLDTPIRKLVDHILLNASSANSLGLYNGKAGLSLSLFEASRYLQDESIEERAFHLLQEALLGKSKDCSFENGLSGIGYVLLHLIKNKFVDTDFDEIFGKQYDKIIEAFSRIEKEPLKLLNSMKVIYFLFNLNSIKREDQRINEIIEKLFEGVELYLSIQFYDFKDINYINKKTDVLNIFETYLKLVVYSDYGKVSAYVIDAYVKLYTSGRIMSSLPVGYYLNEIKVKKNIDKYNEVVQRNKNNAIRSIYPDLYSLSERIDLVKLIRNCGENINCNLLPNIDSKNNGNIGQDILKIIRPNSFHLGYQFGLARYLLFCVNENISLL